MAHRMHVSYHMMPAGSPTTRVSGSRDSAESRPGSSLFDCQDGAAPYTCYDPNQMRAAYGTSVSVSSGKNGRGKTIVIVDAFQDPNVVSELATFDSYFGILPFGAGPGTPTFTEVAPQGLTTFNPSDANMQGWAGEIALDVEWSHAMAPGANIVLVLSTNDTDGSVAAATKYAVDHKLGDIVSMSFGDSEACVNPSTPLVAWHQIFAKATQERMTLISSSGDAGAGQYTCDGSSFVKAVSYPASDPLVTGVGGTDLRAASYCVAMSGCPTQPSPGTYMSEYGWNEPSGTAGFAGNPSGGGGFSILFPRPAYQRGVVHAAMRGVPDVSYNAACNHGVLTYTDIPGTPAGWFTFCGTSAGSPQWAGIVAIADQIGSRDYGFINAALYKISKNPALYAHTFHDIVTGTNSVVEYDTSNNPVLISGYSAHAGWDADTGLGTPIFPGLLARLPKAWSKSQGIVAIRDAAHFSG